MVSFQELIVGLDQIGFYAVALPFIVIFAITFALLEKINYISLHSFF